MSATRPGVFALLFGFSAPVGRAAYAVTGISLMVLKYVLDAGLVYAVTHKVWSPILYLSPVFVLRERDLGSAPAWMFAVLAVMTLPFIWVGATMSVRRAVDAGLSAWLGLAFFLPIVNYVAMIALAVIPTRVGDDGAPASIGAPRGAPVSGGHVDSGVRAALFGVAASIGLAASMGAISIYALKLYGAALFFGTPFMMGAASSYIYNRGRTRSLGMTIVVAEASVLISAASILLFALEGILCLAMAMPIAVALALFGALLGRAMAQVTMPQGARGAAMLLLLPASAASEAATNTHPLYEVVSSVEIDAPPDRVWQNVIGFSELPPPSETLFTLGISYPMRATITGRGVGAVRKCEFSTGPFVEPITRWDEPTRLSFDVASQPIPMHEWSPYRHVTPPHLDGYVRSKRGEFRLTALPGGRTRLEGSTWYELDMAPRAYWTLWSDSLLHAIHLRVLRHVKALSEGEARR